MQELWQDLYDGGADILLGGHWHNYERLAPMDASGAADPGFGVRQFVVGTGGASLSGFGTILPTSEVRDNATHGVMKFTLHASSYDWQFIPIAGQTFTDSGTSSTHGAPGGSPQPAVADFDGDGDTDLSVFHKGAQYGEWSIQSQAQLQFWGLANDVPVPANYDNDPATELAVFHRGTTYGEWSIQGQPLQFWGLANDIPVPGDYNGDGVSEMAVFHRGTTYGEWSIQGQPLQIWGLANDIPVPGNYDNDPAIELAVFHRGTTYGEWSIQGQSLQIWGGRCDIPLPLPHALYALLPTGGGC